MSRLPAFRKRSWDGTLETAGEERLVSAHCVGPRCVCVCVFGCVCDTRDYVGSVRMDCLCFLFVCPRVDETTALLIPLRSASLSIQG